MIKISKEEAAKLRELIPSAYIAVTNKKSSHKNYYAEEAKVVRDAIDMMRGNRSANNTEKG